MGKKSAPKPGARTAAPEQPKRAAAARATSQGVSGSTAGRQSAGGPVKVEATQMGYSGDVRRRVGDVFTIPSMAVFSKRWMKLADPGANERTTTGLEELRKKHDEIIGGRTQRVAPNLGEGESGGADPLGADKD